MKADGFSKLILIKTEYTWWYAFMNVIFPLLPLISLQLYYYIFVAKKTEKKLWEDMKKSNMGLNFSIVIAACNV